MINKVPDNWKYDNSLEMLYLFYQLTDELLSQYTSDTYSLPQHNAITLIDELNEVYAILKQNNGIDLFYKSYIPPIIDELIQKIEEDFLLKQILGQKLESLKTGLIESKTNYKLLRRWINYFIQCCSKRQYSDKYRDEIVNLIINTKEKNKLTYCISNYYISLINFGYSREYIYQTSKKFFQNKEKEISNPRQIIEFFNCFQCKGNEYEYLLLINMSDINYIEALNKNLKISATLKRISVDELRKQTYDYGIVELVRIYDKMKLNEKKHEKIEIIQLNTIDIDPYNAVYSFDMFLKELQTLLMYFKHYNYSTRIYYSFIKGTNGYYKQLSIPYKRKRRPYIEQNTIDSRIENIIMEKSLGKAAQYSLIKAFEMHAEAFESKNTTTLLRTLWTAFETLFMDSSVDMSKDNVVKSSISILQKTYILKKLRLIYRQLCEAISAEKLQEIEIYDFKTFMYFFADNDERSDNMKKIYALLSQNPLLRSRLYNIRKEMSSGDSILHLLENHMRKIEWQLKRLQRIRNIATHLGEEVEEAEIAVDHLHNYFDYITNYMLCKSENGDYVINISTIVFEAKTDNQIHTEILKTSEKLSKDNYLKFLFGPDQKIINYCFEF